MSDITALHSEAMAFADTAFEAKRAGDAARATALLRQAYEKERSAAEMCVGEFAVEPTRSILLRSAASLATQAGLTREAERLIAIALAGDPPLDVADELRDLLEQVNFKRHLELRGVELDPTEIQLSISGDAVGFGISGSREFLSRVEIAQKLAFRTAERKRGQPYRDRGRPVDQIARDLELFVSVPRAASFAVSLRFGAPEQLRLAVDGREAFVQGVVDDIFECLALFNSSDFERLQKRIPDPAYYRNFVGLAKGLAPDGKNVRVVGMTATTPDGPRHVALSNPARVAAEPAQLTDELERVTVRGELRYADSRHASDKIQLITTDGNAVPIRIPEGMMADVVRPMWEAVVVVTARREGRTLILETISLADASSAG